MSTTGTTAGFGGNAGAPRGVSYQPLTKSEIRANADRLYKSSFGDLPDGTLYRDIWGWKTDGEPVTLQKDRFAQLEGAGIFDQYRELRHEKGFSFAHAITEIQKALDTGDWQLPLDIIPDVFTVNPELTPVADFIARATTQDDRVHATPVTAFPSPSWDLENESATQANTGSLQYEHEDVTYADNSFDVLGFGYATDVTDQMILAARNLRSAEGTQEAALMRGMRIEEEKQLILGNDATDGNDDDGWQGFYDLGTDAEDDFDDDNGDDLDDPDDVKEYTEDLIDQCEEAGAPLGSIAVFVDFDWHRTLRRAFDDIQRVTPAPEVDVGFATFAMEGGQVPVFKSHAIPDPGDMSGDDNDYIVAVNMEAVYVATLQEVEAKPLGKIGPSERFAVDTYNTLVDESDGDHIIIGQYSTAA